MKIIFFILLFIPSLLIKRGLKLQLCGLLIAGYLTLLYGQTTITLQPGASAGKDAILHGLFSEVNVNYGSNVQFPAAAWTFGGTPAIIRSVIQFDLSSIPVNAVINSAYLSLYA